MKLSRERAIYLTVLGVGVSALALGEVVFPASPSSAAGAPVEASAKEYSVSPAGGATRLTLTARESVKACSVAEQLRTFGQAHEVDVLSIRDVFQAPAVLDQSRPAAEKAPSSMPNPVERFTQAHHLNGVMVANQQSKAIVDGKTLLVGQSLDGFKLVSVTQQVVTFESEAGQVVLKIPESPAGGARGIKQ
jgi:hypothetical protein